MKNLNPILKSSIFASLLAFTQVACQSTGASHTSRLSAQPELPMEFAASAKVQKKQFFERLNNRWPASAEGGIDGSGGNAYASDPQLVKDVALKMPELIQATADRLVAVHDYIFNDHGVGGDFLREDFLLASEVLAALYTDDNIHKMPVDQLIARGRVKVEFSTPCRHFNGTAESVAYTDGRICVDPKAMSRIPKVNLVEELYALMLHELSHVYGFGEEHGQAIQDFSRTMGSSVVLPSSDAVDDAMWSMTLVDEAFKGLRALVDEKSDVLHICYQIGMLGASSERMIFHGSDYLSVIDTPDSAIGVYVDAITSLAGFCMNEDMSLSRRSWNRESRDFVEAKDYPGLLKQIELIESRKAAYMKQLKRMLYDGDWMEVLGDGLLKRLSIKFEG
jgi:hypothetical protein